LIHSSSVFHRPCPITAEAEQHFLRFLVVATLAEQAQRAVRLIALQEQARNLQAQRTQGCRVVFHFRTADQKFSEQIVIPVRELRRRATVDEVLTPI
jgi:hypothetical protein